MRRIFPGIALRGDALRRRFAASITVRRLVHAFNQLLSQPLHLLNMHNLPAAEHYLYCCINEIRLRLENAARAKAALSEAIK